MLANQSISRKILTISLGAVMAIGLCNGFAGIANARGGYGGRGGHGGYNHGGSYGHGGYGHGGLKWTPVFGPPGVVA
jgi:hypothetical protein